MIDAVTNPAVFLSAYFHEDWDLDALTWRSVVDHFKQDYEDRPHDIESLVAALNAAAKDNVSLSDLGCYYDPSVDGMTSQQWLEAVASHLSAS